MKKTPAIFLFMLAFLGFTIEAQESGVISENKINVRGKPSLVGEVVTQLEKGDKVIILEAIPTPDAKPGEPTNWVKIKLPENTPVWVFSAFIKNSEVTASRLNLRAGPGENYSVLGRIEEGTKVKEIRTQGQWTEIEAPDLAYAFIDASLVDTNATTPTLQAPLVAEQKPSVPAKAQPQPIHTNTLAQGNTASLTNRVPLTTPTNLVSQTTPTNTVAQAKPPEIEAPQLTQPPQVSTNLASQEPSTNRALVPPIVAGESSTNAPFQPNITGTNGLAETDLPNNAQQPELLPPGGKPLQAAAPSDAEPADETLAPPVTFPQAGQLPTLTGNQPLPKRIVRREGIVRPTKSIQAPTWYELIHPITKKTMDYLHEEKLGVDLKSWKGQKVMVSGEEGIDERWPNIPILELDSIQAVP